ncbi:aminotransferase class V-fold PLP-dependent enzyme [Bacillus sp. FJAT-49732]|uniref:Aminotransferase class V-fold PLP-dependent enzyme n=1 Tax=Lederbergia citrisecunda TaxID=2833583 RepID=A0A942YII6_9BACI|nr:GNAT family N-acetyltransferase [Lederbergia citrisecunda]MBS4198363.1 aminotransferase class V-fold PLP-dependent enzyme [Lederbergia citrisecunda]
MSLIYKIATKPSEFEQILKLNYRTFVEEIPQHEVNNSGTLIDKFHDENTYIICMKEEQVIGMICVRSNRPFSLDGKIGEVEKHLPVVVENPCEIRLLAVNPEYRNGRAFLGLAQALIRYCLKLGYDAALISGTTREQKLYGQMGFQPFAYLTGDENAAFQPMYLTKATFDEGIAGRILKDQVNFLPGPATISESVKTALAASPYSHRSKGFETLLHVVQKKLTTLANAKYVQILHGTGTLANDVVAGQLSLLPGKGLILVNGEFGERLVNHAERFDLDFEVIATAWGSPFQEEHITEAMSNGTYNWLWAVHCETSTGVLNDIDMLKNICQSYNVQLSLDCISSLGAVPLNLDGVLFASGVSGKALASYSGLSFVFHNVEVNPNKSIPRYLDLGAYSAAGSIPYSQSSNLVTALAEALKRYDFRDEEYEIINKRYHTIRNGVEEAGLTILSDTRNSASTIMTVLLPEEINAKELGDNLYLNGYNFHYESSYLNERNWMQISCINDVEEKDIRKMLAILRGLCNADREPSVT